MLLRLRRALVQYIALSIGIMYSVVAAVFILSNRCQVALILSNPPACHTETNSLPIELSEK